MAPRFSGQTSIFDVVFFVSKSLLGIEGQRKLEKFAILTRKPCSNIDISNVAYSFAVYFIVIPLTTVIAGNRHSCTQISLSFLAGET